MRILDEIRAVAASLGDVRIMEVCGGHTNTVMRYGLRSALPPNIKLISGPGCPVCVTAQRDIDSVIQLALGGVKIATYGDMLAVPGTKMSLKEARARGADVQMVYSVDELDESDRVFFAVGFETTTPMTALLLKRGIRVFSAHKVMPPPMKLLAQEMRIDGFIDPGHVSTIIGVRAWERLNLPVPQVIAGFQPEQLLHALLLLLKKIQRGERGVVNDYPEVVTPDGNEQARRLVDETMKAVDAEWRGLGLIPASGLVPRDPKLDARLRYRSLLHDVTSAEDGACRCGEVIRGLIEPRECPLFGTACTPEAPRGACMVSATEGACAIAYKYGHSLAEHEGETSKQEGEP